MNIVDARIENFQGKNKILADGSTSEVQEIIQNDVILYQHSALVFSGYHFEKHYF